jgi:hypothetical protein
MIAANIVQLHGGGMTNMTSLDTALTDRGAGLTWNAAHIQPAVVARTLSPGEGRSNQMLRLDNKS